MRVLPLILLSILALASCKKEKENIVAAPTPNVQVQKEYRLTKVEGPIVSKEYFYNDDSLVSSIVQSQRAGSENYNTYTYYTYDTQYRLVKVSTVPGEQAKEYFNFTYNAGLMPIGRYQSKDNRLLEEYTYDGDKLIETKYYNSLGDSYMTATWTYNSAGNPETYTVHYLPGSHNAPTEKTVTRFLEYDNANALRLATPGLHIAQQSSAVNNVIKQERTIYHTGGVTITQTFQFAYEYNNGNFPVKETVTAGEAGKTTTTTTTYYHYNK